MKKHILTMASLLIQACVFHSACAEDAPGNLLFKEDFTNGPEDAIKIKWPSISWAFYPYPGQSGDGFVVANALGVDEGKQFLKVVAAGDPLPVEECDRIKIREGAKTVCLHNVIDFDPQRVLPGKTVTFKLKAKGNGYIKLALFLSGSGWKGIGEDGNGHNPISRPFEISDDDWQTIEWTWKAYIFPEVEHLDCAINIFTYDENGIGIDDITITAE